jgi:hypothetical protein
MNYKYHIAYLGESKKRLPDISRIRGLKNFNSEIAEKLKTMFNNGDIESCPEYDRYQVRWFDALGRTHRPNNLPAHEYADYVAYFTHNINSRDNGPARISKNNQFIEWWKDGKCVATHKSRYGDEFLVNKIEVDHKEYEDFVRNNFDIPNDPTATLYEYWVPREFVT